MSKYIGWKSFERQIVRDLRNLGFEAKRTWDIQFEEGSGLDVTAGKDDLSLAIQAKYGKKPNMRKAYLEAVGAKEKNQTAISVCRFSKDRDTLVVLSWKDFKKLLKSKGEGLPYWLALRSNMRIYKFRAKTNKGKWFYWDLKTPNSKFAEIDWNTVGQSTGLSDKQGKEIYEGDIVKGKYGGVGIVKFGSFESDNSGTEYRANTCYGFYVADPRGENYGEMDNGEFYDYGLEVIGNIYENPELILNIIEIRT